MKLGFARHYWRVLLVLLLAAALSTGLVLANERAQAQSAHDGDSSEKGSSAKIVGGEKVPGGKYPFMASVQDKSAPFLGHKCGGTAIGPVTILTAAHCVGGDLKVIVGKTTFGTQQGQVRNVSKVKVHPRYKKGQGYSLYDVAVLKLEKPVQGIKPIKVATSEQNSLEKPGRMATALGWGKTGTLPFTLKMREVSIPLRSDRLGRQVYGNRYVSPLMLAAGGNDKGTCKRDSGGPLFSNTKSGPVQIGVTSFGIVNPCGDFPAVFAEVNNPSIRGFIDQFQQTYSGQITENTSEYNLEVSIVPIPKITEDMVGTIVGRSRLSVGCTGIWVVEEVNEGSVVVDGRVETGFDNCKDAGLTLTPQEDGTVEFQSDYGATGILTPH